MPLDFTIDGQGAPPQAYDLAMADGRLEDSSLHHSEELLTILWQIHGSGVWHFKPVIQHKMINIRFYMRSKIVSPDLLICGQEAHLQTYDLAVAVWRWEDSSPWGATASPVGQPLRDISLKTSLHGRLELRSPDESCPKNTWKFPLHKKDLYGQRGPSLNNPVGRSFVRYRLIKQTGTHATRELAHNCTIRVSRALGRCLDVCYLESGHLESWSPKLVCLLLSEYIYKSLMRSHVMCNQFFVDK
jgi:hypothetical protein